MLVGPDDAGPADATAGEDEAHDEYDSKKDTPDDSEVSFGAGSRIRTYEGRRPTDLQSVAFNHFAIPAF